MKITAKKLFVLMLIVCVGALPACSSSSSEPEKASEAAEKIISAMMTCPNGDLYNPASVSVIGEGTEETKESEAEKQKEDGQVSENWEKEVGEYFSEGALDKFLTTGPAQMYLIEAEQTGTKISVSEISLLEKNELSEKIQATVSKGGQEETVTLLFKYDPDGLVTEIEPA